MKRVVDLFAGTGAFSYVFHNKGYNVVFANDFTKESQNIYGLNNNPESFHNCDLNDIINENIPAHDILCGGFPCQPFSIAGKKEGFQDPRSNVFWKILEILKYHKPNTIILENVKNLTSHDNGNTYYTIIQELQNIGYYTISKVLDTSKITNIPQHRERIYIVGFTEENGFDFDNLITPDIQKGPLLSRVLHPENGSEDLEEPFTLGELAYVNPKYTISNKLWSYLKKYAEKHRIKGNGFGYGLCTPNDCARTLSARYYKDGSEVLINQGLEKNPRRLTPRECARLMGFDSFGRHDFKIPVSDTQSYKQFGNSVVVPVIKEIAKNMQPYLNISSISNKRLKLPACA